MKRKTQAVLDRLTSNMGAHMAKHPRDAATLAHAKALGIEADVKAKAGEILTANAPKVEVRHG